MLRDVNIISPNDNTCPLCNMIDENTSHDFLVWPGLTTPRATLFFMVVNILRNLPYQYFLSTHQSLSELYQMLLNGSNLLPPDINMRVFNVVAQYINKLTTVRHIIYLCCLFPGPHCWPPLHRPTTTPCV